MRMEEATRAVVSDDEDSIKSDESSGSNRVKYLYSYGGRILPCLSHGKLCYVGGQTRIMAADRNISFADLTVKMAETLGCTDVLLKCQLPGEDLDALVSIKSDEDLESIVEEYDRLQTKLRIFLFPKPSNPCGTFALKTERASVCQTEQGLEKHSCVPLNPLPRIRFAQKATNELSFRKTAALNCMLRNSYQGGSLVGYCLHPHFLVQY